MTPDELHDLADSIVNRNGSFRELMENAENKINRAIKKEVAAERERCAKKVEGLTGANQKEIAAAIRALK